MSKQNTDIIVKGRITINPRKMSGQPCIRDLRMPVATILAMLGDGMTHDEIISEFPDLTKEDINAATSYAMEVVQQPQHKGKKIA